MKEVQLITYEDLLKFKQEILDAIHEEISELTQPGRDEYLTAEKVKEILGCSSKQFQIIRQRKLITHIVVGRKIYVKRSDLDAYLEEYVIPKRA